MTEYSINVILLLNDYYSLSLSPLAIEITATQTASTVGSLGLRENRWDIVEAVKNM